MTPEEQQRFDLMKVQVRVSDEAFNFHLKRANEQMNQIDEVYQIYKGAPVEQSKLIPLVNFVKTRFVSIDEYNQVSREDIRRKFAQVAADRIDFFIKTNGTDIA